MYTKFDHSIPILQLFTEFKKSHIFLKRCNQKNGFCSSCSIELGRRYYNVC